MRKRDVLGKRIVAVEQSRQPANADTQSPPWIRVDSIVLEDGTVLVPHCVEYSLDIENGATILVCSKKLQMTTNGK